MVDARVFQIAGRRETIGNQAPGEEEGASQKEQRFLGCIHISIDRFFVMDGALRLAIVSSKRKQNHGWPLEPGKPQPGGGVVHETMLVHSANLIFLLIKQPLAR